VYCVAASRVLYFAPTAALAVSMSLPRVRLVNSHVVDRVVAYKLNTRNVGRPAVVRVRANPGRATSNGTSIHAHNHAHPATPRADTFRTEPRGHKSRAAAMETLQAAVS
jgi:hypothetical protein